MNQKLMIELMILLLRSSLTASVLPYGTLKIAIITIYLFFFQLLALLLQPFSLKYEGMF